MEPTDIINSMFAVQLFSVPVIALVVVVSIAAAMLLYIDFKNQSNNPYYMAEKLRQHKKYITVFYLKEVGNGNFIFDDNFEKCPTGEQGVFLRRYNLKMIVPEDVMPPSTKSKILFVKVFSSNSVVPVKLIDYDSLVKSSGSVQNALVILKGEEEKQSLFLEHHFSVLAKNVAEISRRGGGLFNLLKDAGGTLLVVALVIGSMMIMYAYANDTSKMIMMSSQNSTNAYLELFKHQQERNEYCSQIIGKYGTDWEKAYYAQLVAKYNEAGVNITKPG